MHPFWRGIIEAVAALIGKKAKKTFPFELMVLGETYQGDAFAVANAHVTVQNDLVYFAAYSSSHGVARFELPEGTGQVRVSIRRDSYLPLILTINPFKGIERTTVTLKLIQYVPPEVPNLTRPVRNGRDVNVVFKGITAFKLLHHYINDRAKYEEFLVSIKGFNLVRVLTSARIMFHLDADVAREHVLEFTQDLARKGFYVSLVAIADSNYWPNWKEHFEKLTRLVENEDNVLIETANEPWHDTQARELHDMEFLQNLYNEVNPKCYSTTGPGHLDEDLFPLGEFVTRHLDRGDSEDVKRDQWNMVRRVRELEWVSSVTGHPVHNWEPLGAGDYFENGRRYINPDIALAFGVLSRIFSVPTVFHCESGLWCDPLSPHQTLLGANFLLGANVIPDTQRLAFKNATWHDSPVRGFDTSKAVRVYSGINGNTGITVVLGGNNPDIQWNSPWRVNEVLVNRPEIQVISIIAD